MRQLEQPKTLKEHLAAAIESIDVNDPESARAEIKAALEVREQPPDEPFQFKSFFTGVGLGIPAGVWLIGRFITSGHVDLINYYFHHILPLMDLIFGGWLLMMAAITLYFIVKVGYLALFVGRREE